jgi:fimbrial chaperone protein
VKKTVVFYLCFIISASFQCVPVFATGLQPRIALSPPRLELNMGEGGASKSISVLNLSELPMPIEVRVQNWDYDENNKFRVLPPSEQSLDQWLIINPVSFVIPPKSQQTVRLAIRPKRQPAQGEHRAMIFFAERPLASDKKHQINFRVGVPVYAYSGEVLRTANLNAIDYAEGTQELIITVKNTGNSYVRPRGRYLVMESTVAVKNKELFEYLGSERTDLDIKGILNEGVFSYLPVLPGALRTLRHKITIKSNKGRVAVKHKKIFIRLNVAGNIIDKVFYQYRSD